MERELALLLALLPHKEETSALNRTIYRTLLSADKELIIAQSGIGKVNAALATHDLISSYTPDIVLSTGVAGGAQRDILPLDIVVADSTAYHDVYCGTDVEYGQIQGLPTVFATDKRLVNKAREMEKVHIGLIATGDWFVDTKEKALSILAHYPTAAAFDMESSAIAQVCFLHSVPFLSLRIISDNPLSEQSKTQYDNFWEHLSQGSFSALMDFLRRV